MSALSISLSLFLALSGGDGSRSVPTHRGHQYLFPNGARISVSDSVALEPGEIWGADFEIDYLGSKLSCAYRATSNQTIHCHGRYAGVQIEATSVPHAGGTWEGTLKRGNCETWNNSAMRRIVKEVWDLESAALKKVIEENADSEEVHLHIELLNLALAADASWEAACGNPEP